MKNLALITFTALLAFFVITGCEKTRLADVAGTYVSEPGTTKTTVSTSAKPDTTDYITIKGDIKVGIGYYRIPAGDSVEINLNFQTVNTYCSKSIVQYTSTIDAAKNFTLDIVNIRAPKNCAGAIAPDWQVWTGDVFKRKLIGIGTHQLTIKLNGVTYTGTIVVAAKNITINWNYSSGVIMLSHVIDG